MNIEEILVKLGIDISPLQKGLRDGTKEIESTAKKSEFLGLKFGELKKLTRELGAEFPVAGLAAKLLLNPIAATFGAAITIFGVAKEKLSEWNKEMDEAAKIAAKPDFLEAINARKKAFEEASIKSALFADSMDNLVDSESVYREGIKRSIDTIHQLTVAQNALADAQLGLDTEELKHRLDVGLMDETQFYTALAAIERKHETDKLERERDAHRREIAEKEKELYHVTLKKPELEKAAEKAEAAATSARADVIMGEGTLNSLPEKIERSNSDIAETEKQIANLGGEKMVQNRLVSEPIFAKFFGDRFRNYQDALKNRENLKSTQAKLTAELPGRRTNAAMLEAAAARSQGRIGKNEEALNNLPDEIKALISHFGIQDATGAGVATINAAKAGLRTQGDGPTFDENMEAFDRARNLSPSIFGNGDNASVQKSLQALERLHRTLTDGTARFTPQMTE